MNFTVNTFDSVCPGAVDFKIESLAPYVVFMLLSVAFSAGNQPSVVPLLVNEYISQIDNINDKIQWIEYTRHGIMKSVVLCGVPRVINSEIALYNGLLPEYQSLLRTTPLNQNSNPSLWEKRGKSLFDRVYGDLSKSRSEAIYRGDPDLGLFVDELYGSLVSDTTYLSDMETELEVVVSLSMVDIIPQLKDHLVGAANVGASPKQIADTQNIITAARQCIKKIK